MKQSLFHFFNVMNWKIFKNKILICLLVIFFYFLNERLQKYTFKLHVLAKCFWNKFWFYNHFYSENRQKYGFFSSDFCCILYKLFLIHKPRIVLKHCLSSQQYISPDVVTALIKWQSSFWKRRRYHVGILHF